MTKFININSIVITQPTPEPTKVLSSTFFHVLNALEAVVVHLRAQNNTSTGARSFALSVVQYLFHAILQFRIRQFVFYACL
jgi:hypothetical protein